MGTRGSTATDHEFRRAIDGGNEDCVEGFYWVQVNGETRIAEWRWSTFVKGNRPGWLWSLTRGEEANQVDRILERIDKPEDNYD